MKKFIILFVMLLSIGAVNAFAQCPPGWTYSSIAFGPDVAGCTWQVEMCHKCGLTGSDPNNLRVISIKPANPQVPCGAYSPDQTWLRTQVQALHSSLCTITPCTEGCREFIIEFPLCVQWVTYGWQNLPDPSYQYATWLEYCTDGDYCQLKQRRCNDYNQGGLQIPCPVGGNITYTLIEGTCQPTQIEMPGAPTFDFVGRMERSECFKKYNCSAP